MAGEVHPNVARVVAAGAAAGLTISVRRYPAGTRTAEDAARAIGCDVAQIVKSLIFLVDGRPVVVLASGATRVDVGKLAMELGGHAARRATGEEVRAATGYPIGGVPPIGHLSPSNALMDHRLFTHRVVWAAAGLPDAVFPAPPADLARAAGARTVDVAEVNRPGPG